MRKIEEVARMDEHAASFEQIDDEIVFGLKGRHLQHAVPAAFRAKDAKCDAVGRAARHAGMLSESGGQCCGARTAHLSYRAIEARIAP